jgi:hypothetical protein
MPKNLEIPQFSSCLPEKPFIKYGSGDSTEIVPNLPQTNEFSAYGIVPVDMGTGVFKTIINPVIDPFIAEITALKVGTAAEITAKIDAKLRTVYAQYINVRNFPKIESRDVYDPQWLALGTYPNPPKYITITETIQNPVTYLGDMPLKDVVNKVNTEGVKPIVLMNYAQQATVSFDKPPATTAVAKQSLFVVEEYRMAAYLGKYGMGRVVRTFSLLPGEKTTITVKTYHDKKTTKSKSENVLDSYSESSANDFESLVQDEQEKKTENKQSTDFTGTLSFSGGSKFLTGISASATLSTKNESTRNSMVKNLNRALEKHVNTSNSNRQIQVNTTTTETTTDTEETATVRELVNINKSRVLNFVFRQLHQQYITVTYLSDIKIAYTNGYEADTRLVSLGELRGLLTSVLTPASIDEVERNILKNYCVVYGYDDKAVGFIENKTLYLGTCVGTATNIASSQAPTTTSKTASGLDADVDVNPVPLAHGGIVKFWRKKKNIVGTVPKSDFGFEIKVPGVILSVTESTLKTSSVLAESILGQADALDCFNLKIQDAEAQKGYIDNTERLTRLQNEEWKARHDRAKQQQEIERMQTDNELVKFQMEIVREIKDPVQRAEMYKKIFGTCCDTPQTVIEK